MIIKIVSLLTFFLVAVADFGFPIARLLFDVEGQAGRAGDGLQS